MAPAIKARQDVVVENPNDRVIFDQRALAIKWTVFSLIFLILFLWFTVGYWHAKRRMRNGSRPLMYHRWMVPYEQRRHLEPGVQNQFSFYRIHSTGGYGMDAMPPPVYNSNIVPPPTYQPPRQASKGYLSQAYDVPPPVPSPQNGPSNFETLPPVARSPRTPWTRRINPFR